MKPFATKTQSCLLLSMFFAVPFTGALAQVNIGDAQVSTINHAFPVLSVPPVHPVSFEVGDYLIGSFSGGGVQVPSVSANFDGNNQFSLTISAPAGERFLVQPPAGQTAFLGAELNWLGPDPYGNNGYGTVALSFSDLTGTAPAVDADNSSSDLTDSHQYFAFNNVHSLGFTNAFSFSSMTLTATVPSANTGQGALDYTPDTGNALLFYSFTSQNTDPGSFVSIVPEPAATSLMVLAVSLLTGFTRLNRR